MIRYTNNSVSGVLLLVDMDDMANMSIYTKEVKFYEG